jgi:hypothetical protein
MHVFNENDVEFTKIEPSYHLMACLDESNARITNRQLNGDKSVTLTLDANIRIIYDENSQYPKARNEVKILKKYGKIGDSFFIYHSVNGDNKETVYPVFAYLNDHGDDAVVYMYREKGMTGIDRCRVRAPYNSLDALAFFEKGDYFVEYPTKKAADNIAILDYFIIGDEDDVFKTTAKGWEEIHTGTDLAKTTMTISSENEKWKFNAMEHALLPSNPSFEESLYQFKDIEITIPSNNFVGGGAVIDVSIAAMSLKAKNMMGGRSLGSMTGRIIIPKQF